MPIQLLPPRRPSEGTYNEITSAAIHNAWTFRVSQGFAHVSRNAWLLSRGTLCVNSVSGAFRREYCQSIHMTLRIIFYSIWWKCQSELPENRSPAPDGTNVTGEFCILRWTTDSPDKDGHLAKDSVQATRVWTRKMLSTATVWSRLSSQPIIRPQRIVQRKLWRNWSIDSSSHFMYIVDYRIWGHIRILDKNCISYPIRARIQLLKRCIFNSCLCSVCLSVCHFVSLSPISEMVFDASAIP